MKKKYIDLQMHSLYSDGECSPRDLVKHLRKYNIKVASLTDHNTVKGIPEFKKECRKYSIKAIPGIEFYVRYKRKRLHLLGYDLDIKNTFLNKELIKIHKYKFNLLKRITPLLKKKGIIIELDILAKEKADYIGMNNLIRHIESKPSNVKRVRKVLKKKNYEHWELIKYYFTEEKNTSFPEVYIPIELGIKIIKKAGGIPILSHPGQQLRFEDDYLILELKKKGIKGIEVFSSHYKYSQVAHYLRLAKEHKLIVTGGSDYHGDLENDLCIQRTWDYILLPYKLYTKIKEF